MATSSKLAPLKTVGHATPRIDAVERVTGKATYTGDIHIPDMLYARVLRSPHAHARINKIHSHARELQCRLGRRLHLGWAAIRRRGQEDHSAPALFV